MECFHFIINSTFLVSTSAFLDAGPPSKASRDGRLNAGQLGGVSGAPSARKTQASECTRALPPRHALHSPGHSNTRSACTVVVGGCTV